MTWVLLAVVCLAAGGFGGWFAGRSRQAAELAAATARLEAAADNEQRLESTLKAVAYEATDHSRQAVGQVLAPIAEVRVEEGAISEEQAETTRSDYSSSANDNTIIGSVAADPGGLGWVGFAFADQSREVDRVAVSELAGILRIAIALDESRSGRITDFTCVRERDRLVIAVPNVDDISLEQLAINQTGGLFEETYGMKVLLRRVRK